MLAKDYHDVTHDRDPECHCVKGEGRQAHDHADNPDTMSDGAKRERMTVAEQYHSVRLPTSPAVS